MRPKKNWLGSRPSATARRSAMLATSAAFLLAGCAPEIVATPVNVKKVPSALLVDPGSRPPQCLPPKDEYTVPELEAALLCERSFARRAHSTLRALQRAVRTREAAIRAIKQTP